MTDSQENLTRKPTVKPAFSFQQGPGFRMYSQILNQQTVDYVFLNTTVEVCFFAFENKAAELLYQYGVHATRLITDTVVRKQLGISDDVLRRNGNPRESKLLKKSGKTSMYLSKYIRDYVRRNFDIYQILSEFYGNDQLAFTNGLDYLIYKPAMSEKSLPILDCHIFEQLQDATSTTNPFHYVSLVCLSSNTNNSQIIQPLSTNISQNVNTNNFPVQTNTTSKSNIFRTSGESDISVQNPDTGTDGSIYLLENFDVHFEDIKVIVGPQGKYPIGKQKKGIDVSLLENLDIDGINEELSKIHARKNNLNPANPTSNQIFNGTSWSSVSPFKPLTWIKINMKAGDFLIFDCRIPYMTSANKPTVMPDGQIVNVNPVAYVPVSLRPVGANWYFSAKFKELTDSVKNGKSGNWTKRTYKGCNLEEFRWRTSQNVTPGSELTACTDTKDFTAHDRLIFGIDRYNIS